MTRVRVLNCLHRSHPGGAHWRVVWIAGMLEPLGYDTTVLLPRGGTNLFTDSLDELGFPYVRTALPGIRRSLTANAFFALSLPWIVIRIAMIMEREAVELVHVNGATNLQPVLAALLRRVPVCWHFNDMQTPRWYVKALTPLLRSRHVRLLVATEEIVHHYGLVGDADIRWLRVPAPAPAVGSRSDGSVSRDGLGIPDEARIVGFVGNLVPVKGSMDFLEATIPMLERDDALHAVIVGPPVPAQRDHASKLQQMAAASSVADRIHFVGYQTNVHSWLALFDVFVFPSHSEACPIAVLEAMQVGVPMVATRVGEVPRMLQGTDLPVLEPGDIGGLTKGIARMLALDLTKRQNLADQLRERVIHDYSLRAVSEIHDRAYAECLAARS